MTTPSGYPPPTPTRTRKVDIFHIDDYVELDKYACAVCTPINPSICWFVAMTTVFSRCSIASRLSDAQLVILRPLISVLRFATVF